MGILSAPVCVYVVDIAGHPVDPAAVTVLVEVPDHLARHGLCQPRTGSQYSGSLQAAFASAHPVSSVYGYLSRAEINAWKELFEAVFDQHRHVAQVEAHWWCADEEFPFVLVQRRPEVSDMVITDGMGVVRGADPVLFVGHLWSALWSTVALADVDPVDVTFDMDKYQTVRARYPESFWMSMQHVPLCRLF